ncbi:MAG: family 16 glycoside hydrolase [Planctomycetota bacterium]
MHKPSTLGLTFFLIVFALVQLGCRCSGPGDGAAKPNAPEPVALLESMEQWEPIIFGGEGEVRFIQGVLVLDMGGPLTGVKYTGDMTELLGEDLQPYEITLQAKRVEGLDFFCCLTFPVGTEGHVSLVLGGWAGSTVGISSLDGYDAASNKTSQIMRFEQDQWYDIKVRVTAEKIDCFLDGEQIIDVNRAEYQEFSLRNEVMDTAPLGLCTFQTRGDIRGLKIRRLEQ